MSGQVPVHGIPQEGDRIPFKSFTSSDEVQEIPHQDIVAGGIRLKDEQSTGDVRPWPDEREVCPGREVDEP